MLALNIYYIVRTNKLLFNSIFSIYNNPVVEHCVQMVNFNPHFYHKWMSKRED